MASLEDGKDDVKLPKAIKEPTAQISFEDSTATEILEELKLLDVTTLTPIEALNKLYQLANRAKN